MVQLSELLFEGLLKLPEKLFQEIYENDFGLTRGSNNYGIFINNPSWEQLNIGPKEQRALKRFYRREKCLRVEDKLFFDHVTKAADGFEKFIFV
jgi:hypothetical protein